MTDHGIRQLQSLLILARIACAVLAASTLFRASPEEWHSAALIALGWMACISVCGEFRTMLELVLMKRRQQELEDAIRSINPNLLPFDEDYQP